MAWWKTYFDDVFFELHQDLFPESESRREISAMLELLGLPVGGRILDAPCGWGRHTTLFPPAGQDAFGADLSFPLLQRAASAGRRLDLPVRYAAADLRALPFRDHAFDAVVNVFTSLGLFLDDAEDLRALAEAHRVLRPGGRLLLESMHRDDVVCTYAARDHWTLPNGIEVHVRRRFDPVSGISYERLRWRQGDRKGRKRHALRLRTATEIHGLLTAAGFEDIAYYGNWSGQPLSHESPRLIAVARAP